VKIVLDTNVLIAALIARGFSHGKCDCIVTGDKDLLVFKQHQGIDIFSPRDFLMNEKID